MKNIIIWVILGFVAYTISPALWALSGIIIVATVIKRDRNTWKGVK